MTATRTRSTVRDAGQHIAARRPFVAGNGPTLSAELHTSNGAYWSVTGDLPEQYATELRELFRDADRAPVYVVYSYATPIAWVVIEPGTGWVKSVTMPPVRYSVTTSQHQHTAAHALGLNWSAVKTTPRHTGRGRTPYVSRAGY